MKTLSIAFCLCMCFVVMANAKSDKRPLIQSSQGWNKEVVKRLKPHEQPRRYPLSPRPPKWRPPKTNK